MGEWTKGDWIATPDPHGSSDDWCIGVEGKIDMVAVCSKRDANLLRSAKDMAEALRMVVAADTAEDWSRAVDYARKALAKAGVK